MSADILGGSQEFKFQGARPNGDRYKTDLPLTV